MNHADRLAEITRLRGAIAAGSQSVGAVHCTLARHLEALQRRDEAIAVYANAARIAEEQGLLLLAHAITKRLRWLTPNDAFVAARYARIARALEQRGIRLQRPSHQKKPAASVIALQPVLDRQIRASLDRRCVISIMGDRASFHIEVAHHRVIPASWFARARYAVEVDGYSEPIPCIAAVTFADPSRHVLALTPASPDAKALLRRCAHVLPTDRTRTLSNIVSCVIDTGRGDPVILRNVFHWPANGGERDVGSGS